jgi:hypothetical protein
MNADNTPLHTGWIAFLWDAVPQWLGRSCCVVIIINHPFEP